MNNMAAVALPIGPEASPKPLGEIAVRAMTLAERQRAWEAAGQPLSESAAGHELLQQWRKSVAPKNQDGFLRLLAWKGLDERSALAVLSFVPDMEELPEWVNWLEPVRRHGAEQRDNGLLNQSESIAFAHLLAPWVEMAAAEAAQLAGSEAFALCSKEAYALLQRSLLSTLASLCETVLMKEFSVYRARNPLRHGYKFFVTSFWTETAYWRFWTEYPALARLLALTAQDWTSSIAAFLRHALQDRPQLERLHGGQLGQLQKLRAGISDRHRGGRTAIWTTWQSGAEFIYKPRSLECDRAWERFLAWCVEAGAPVDLKTFQSIAVGCGDDARGWCTIVRHQPCQSQEQVHQYYRRCGALAAIAYALRANDLHYENVIAQGEFPLVIDLETLMQSPAVRNDESRDTAFDAASRVLFGDSVVRTLLLPRVHADTAGLGEQHDPSGIAGGFRFDQQVQVPYICFPNSDSMCRGEISSIRQRSGNTVLLGDNPVDARTFSSDVVEGFGSTYDFLLRRRDRILAPGGPLCSMFDRVVSRFILRDTRTYAALLKRSLHPGALRGGLQRSFELEKLSRAFAERETQPVEYLLLDHEQQALERGDIPFFQAQASERSILLENGGRLSGFLEYSPLESIQRQFQQLSEEDRDRQLAFVISSLRSTRAVADAPQAPVSAAHESVVSGLFTSEALRLAAQIEAHAIYAPDGSAGWITERYRPAVSRWEVTTMEPQLFDGLAGVCLFLTAVEPVTGTDRFAGLADAAAETLLRVAESQPAPGWIRRDSPGAANGLSSVTYALLCRHWWRPSDRLFSASLKFAEWAWDRVLDQETPCGNDIFDGLAGVIPVFLMLHRRGAPIWLDRAIQAGRLLLERRTPAPNGLRVWMDGSSALAGGFAHGASGIASSLARLAQVSGIAEFREAAQEALEFEDSLETPEGWGEQFAANGTIVKAPYSSWCHGAPGIALARLIAAAPSPTLRHALDKCATSWSNVDYICCGNLGRADILHTAGLMGNGPSAEAARRIAAAAAEQAATESGAYRIGVPGGPFNPSLFQGVSGVGYTMLRIATGASLPSVLSWQDPIEELAILPGGFK